MLVAVGALSNAPKVIAQESSEPNKPAAVNAQAMLDDNLFQKVNRLHEEAAHFLDQQEPEKAIEKEKDAVQLAPQYWLPHAALGYLYFGRGGPAILEAAESVKTTHPHLAVINLALLLQYFHMYEQSIKSFKQVLESDPQSSAAKVGIAACFIGEKKLAEGRKLLDEAFASAPKDPAILDASQELTAMLTI